MNANSVSPSAQDVDQVQALGAEYEALEANSQVLWSEWETLSTALEDDAQSA